MGLYAANFSKSVLVKKMKSSVILKSEETKGLIAFSLAYILLTRLSLRWPIWSVKARPQKQSSLSFQSTGIFLDACYPPV